MDESADIVVAGAGHNSLIAACYLAKAGYRCLVLDARHVPGGGATTEEILLPGYGIDTCATGHTLIRVNPLLTGDELGLIAGYGLRYIDPDPVAHVAFPDGEQLTMWLDRDRTAAEIARFSAADSAAYLRLLDEYDEVKSVFSGSQFTPVGFGPSLDARLAEHPRGGLWQRRRALSAWDVIRHEFGSRHVQAFMLWMAFQTNQAVDLPGSGVLAYSLVFGRQQRSWSIPAGGSGRLTEALTGYLHRHGSTVLCDKRVTRLLLDRDRCAGVETADGGQYRAGKAVLSTIHITQLRDMAPARAWPEEFHYGIDTYDVGIPGFGVYLATSAPPEFAAPDGGTQTAVSAGTVGWPEDVIRLGQDLRAGRFVADVPWLLVATPTLADPARAPSGKHTVKLLSQQVYQLPAGMPGWEVVKARHAKRQLEHLRSCAPGFTDDVILAQLVKSPADYEQLNPHMVHGAFHGGDRGVAQTGPLRPVPGWASHRMPIAGLYQTGATTHPGGSITGAPGRNAAIVLLHDLGHDPAEVMSALPTPEVRAATCSLVGRSALQSGNRITVRDKWCSKASAISADTYESLVVCVAALYRARTGDLRGRTGPVDARWWRSMSGRHGAARKWVYASTRGSVRDGSARGLRTRRRPARSVSFPLGTDGPAGCSLWTGFARRRSYGRRRTGGRDKIRASRWRGTPAVFRFDEGGQAMRSDTRPVIRWNPVERVWETGCRGYSVLSIPRLNKGTAFTDSERAALGLTGLLPSRVLTLDQQAERAYRQCSQQSSALGKNIYLTALHDRNEVLFYRVLTDHLSELLPIVYTPTIGEAIQRYSHQYRRPRGVYLSIDAPGQIETALRDSGLPAGEVDLIVATDAQAILGIGDWGVGGIDIAVGKLAVYTAAAGIDPARTLPVVLDVGTDRAELLEDPLYLGVQRKRPAREPYDAFIDAYVTAALKVFPGALLHWEDFGPGNARRILDRYRDHILTFNDDMQGTGAVNLAAVWAGARASQTPLTQHRIVIFGSGTAGIGIADQLHAAMTSQGLDTAAARARFWCLDRQGLLTDDMTGLRDFQVPYARPATEIADWAGHGTASGIGLAEVVGRVHPTILVGTSTVHGAFTEQIVREMAAHADRPVILPMSNPTSLSEATPADLVRWTGGRALIATGSPFAPVIYQGVTYQIGQANNALIFPGLGLGTLLSRARRITDHMITAAAQAVAGLTDTTTPGTPLLPPIDDLRTTSAQVALAVAQAAAHDGVAGLPGITADAVSAAMWQPRYAPVRAV